MSKIDVSYDHEHEGWSQVEEPAPRETWQQERERLYAWHDDDLRKLDTLEHHLTDLTVERDRLAKAAALADEALIAIKVVEPLLSAIHDYIWGLPLATQQGASDDIWRAHEALRPLIARYDALKAEETKETHD